MREEDYESAFFDKERASETMTILKTLLEAFDFDPVEIENEADKVKVERVYQLLENFSQSGWEKMAEVSVADKALVEYLPLVLLERLATLIKEGRDDPRLTRIFEYMASRLSIPKPCAEQILRLTRVRVNGFLVYVHENNPEVDLEEMTMRAGEINGALLP